MRLIFMGSPEFAVPALRGLHDFGYEVVGVYCQSPKPSGRGQRLTRCAIHRTADELGIPVRTPARLRGNEEELAYLRSLELDYGVVVAYGLILPRSVLDTPHYGFLNIHASLLPRWRGAAPIQAAILAGDASTGVTIMQMDAGLDTGPVLMSESVMIGDSDTSATLHERLSTMGGRLILSALAGNWPRSPQAVEGAYAPKLSRADSVIDWHQPAAVIERRIRAFTPWPGTETKLDGRNLKILAAHVVGATGDAGVVIDDRLTIACGHQALRLTRVKMPGGAAVDAPAFLRGHPVPIGTRLG